MPQITVRGILDVLRQLKANHPENWLDTPIYIGDDEELNGVHDAYYCQVLENSKDDLAIKDLIEDCPGATGIQEDQIAILIS